MTVDRIHIVSKDGLLKHIEETDGLKIKRNKPAIDKSEFSIFRKSFKNYYFTNEFHSLELRSCKFTDCVFEGINAFYLIFHKCKFVNCEFKNSVFSHLFMYWDDLQFIKCRFKNVQWDEGALFNVWFEGCEFKTFGMIGLVPSSYVVFKKCNFENSQFQALTHYIDENEIDEEVEDIVFHECIIEYSYFNNVDLRNSFFVDTILYKSAFLDCEFRPGTISRTDESKIDLPNYASIDFQSILKSDKFDKQTLENYFNIHEAGVKEIVKGMASKMNFKSVFISYSFKDEKFANFLNDELKRRGVKTFLWGKDAPSGRPLEDIMSSNVKKHDKTLFIASANSLKSIACQYELSEGRKKQEATWNSIFFPIHIDDFLFTVKKNQIRPISKADEYWENIEELKRINSTDFTKFDINDFEPDHLDEMINKIIKELKLNSE